MKITASRAALSIPAANAPALCVVDQTEIDAGAGAHTGCEDVHTAQLPLTLAHCPLGTERDCSRECDCV